MHYVIRRGLLTLIFVVLAAFIVYYQYTHGTFSDQSADKLPDIGGRFALVDQNDKPRKSEDFSGKYMLVYFGYSYCPDICPMGLQNISAALKQIKADRDQVAVLFITIDPERDTVDLLKDYSANFDPNILYLTGSVEAIEKAKKAYKVYAAKSQNSKTTEYLMDHSTLIYLMDRSGKLIDHFPHTVDPQTLADNLNRRLAEDRQHA